MSDELDDPGLRKLSVRFVGDISEVWMSGFQRMEALRSLGVRVDSTDLLDFRRSHGLLDKIGPRLLRLPTWPRAIADLNAALLELCRQPAPDIAWFEWPRWVKSETLERMRKAWPGTVFVCFQDDNPFGLRREKRLWKLFRRSIPFWDVHFVKRPIDLVNFRTAGAKDVRLFRSGYYEPVFGIEEEPQPTEEIAFIGAALDYRISFIEELVFREKIDVCVYGPAAQWKRTLLARRRPDLLRPQIHTGAYVDAIRRHRICLAFVSHSNLDEYTMRTFEIPAAGGFMLAERTPAHRSLYVEGEEVELFESPAECAKKIRFYLANEAKRRKVAAAGARRSHREYGLARSMRGAIEGLLPLVA